MNGKTKRPPFRSTAAVVVEHKVSDASFSKWSKMLHLISPPNKKRRSTSIVAKDDDDEEKEEEEGTIYVLKKEFSLDQFNKQKSLNRRAMYIPNPPPIDGPKDASHQWSLYRATYQKLRQNTLPLSETIHLRKMLILLQPQQFKQQKKIDPVTLHTRVTKVTIPVAVEDEEDDVPLGTLLEKKTTPHTVTTPIKKNQIVYQRYLTPTFYHMPYYQPQQPYYYYNTAQFI
ncbi:hypothetical protein INT47_007299 [Mucor saturninus]|uniref:Uncharacterized protein n=1 Tax=Mucor saturninus TaxID=64648 RepID=A0A8H7V3X7_9FUNG|nr:hypothetical protein INT47_007299 [Mucor saturninus]